MVDAAQDPCRVGGNRIRASATQIVRRKSFENFMRHAVGGGDGNLQGLTVGDTRSHQIGRRDICEPRVMIDLFGRTVNQGHPNAQTSQQCDV